MGRLQGLWSKDQEFPKVRGQVNEPPAPIISKEQKTLFYLPPTPSSIVVILQMKTGLAWCVIV